MSALLECIINQLVHPLLAHDPPASTPRVLEEEEVPRLRKRVYFYLLKKKKRKCFP